MKYQLQPFPLYDELLPRVKKDFIPEDGAISPRVSQLPPQRLEELQLIIVHHAIKTNTFPDTKSIPYGGKIFSGGLGASYQMKDLPMDLKCIIWAYLEA